MKKYTVTLTYGFAPGCKTETLEITLIKGFGSRTVGHALLVPALFETALEQIQELSALFPANEEKMRNEFITDVIERIAKDYPEQLVAVAENWTKDE